MHAYFHAHVFITLVYLAAPSSSEEVKVGPTVTLAGLPGPGSGGGSGGSLLLRRAAEHSSRPEEVEPLETRRRLGRAVLAAVGSRHTVMISICVTL